MIVAGEHRPYDYETLEAINDFCKTHDCVIYTNHLSNLHTEYAVNGNLFLSTSPFDDELKEYACLSFNVNATFNVNVALVQN